MTHFAKKMSFSCKCILFPGCLDIFAEKRPNTDHENCCVTHCNACVRWLIPFSTKMVLVLRDVRILPRFTDFRDEWWSDYVNT